MKKIFGTLCLSASLLMVASAVSAQDVETPTYSNARIVSVDPALRLVVLSVGGVRESLTLDDLMPGTGSFKAGDLVIVTKTPTGRSGVYTAPANAVPGRAVLRKVGEVVVPPVGGGLVTGGALHPCEKRVVLRTYTVMLEYRFTGGLETLFEGAPTVIAAGREPQGEAVTYSANGRSIFTISEGKSAPLHRSDCAR